MVKSRTSLLFQWNLAFKEKKFRRLFLFSLMGLALCGVFAPYLFSYIENRSGLLLNDFILDVLPPYNLSFWIFSVLYLLITSSIVYLLFHPYQFLFALQAYIILTIFRFITLLLVPLEQPADLVMLYDPLVDKFFYQRPITKDLFFSGHTSILFLLALIIRQPVLRPALFTGTFLIAFLILFQHAHYTIDVIAAPLFAWMAYRCGKFLTQSLWDSREPGKLVNQPQKIS